MKRQNNMLLACLLILFQSASWTFAQQEPDYREGELLIKFKSGTSLQATGVSHASLGSQVSKRFRKTGIELVKLRADLTTKEAIELYKKDPRVEYAEPNYKFYIHDLFPDDPMFDDLWGLHNTGQAGGAPDADIDAPEAWQVKTGSDAVIVAVIDTGVDYTHQDLSANMWRNDAELNGSPGVDDDGNGYVDDIYGIDALEDDTDPMDDYGHGTHCAGTIGAVGDNGIGIVGVNWNVRIMALRFMDADGGYASDAIECLSYAITMKQDYGHNIRVTSNSWGGGGYSQSMYNAIQVAKDADILFVASAGNDYKNNDLSPKYPSSYDLPNIIAVSATNRNDDLWYTGCPYAPGSNWGPTTVDVAAPGVSILSCEPGNGYQYMSGTSMAAPHVAGLAALTLAEHPEYGWSNIKWNILITVDRLASLDGLVLTGGRINASNVLTCTPGLVYLRAATPLSEFGIPQNTQVVVRVLVGTCETPSGDATVTADFDNGEPSLTLHDDGIEPDVIAGDGVYAAYWTPQVSGYVTLTLTASVPGYDPVSEQVPGAVAYLEPDFVADATDGAPPLTVNFTDLSQADPGIESWLWDFGDGESSTEQHPSHTYDSTGNYTVSLAVGYKDADATETKTDYIHVVTEFDPPGICSVTPDEGLRTGTTTVTVTGYNLWPTPHVSIYGGGPRLVGSHSVDGSFSVSGSYAYVACSSTTHPYFSVCDISDPEGISSVGGCFIPEPGQEVYISGEHAYVAAHGAGLQVIDISDPAQPYIVGSCDTPSSASDVHVLGDYAYVADSWSGLQIIDISNPAQPYIVGSYDTHGVACDVYVSGGYAYLAAQSAGLQVIDVSDPYNPRKVGSCGNVAWGVHVSGNYAYLTGTSEFSVVDVSNPSAPSVVGSCDTPGVAKGVYVSGRYAYVADGGLQVIDVGNPLGPIPIGTCKLSNGGDSDVHVQGRYAYLDGINIVDISSPADPSAIVTSDVLGSSSRPEDIYVSGDYAYVASNLGLQVIDVSSSASPVARSSCGGPADAVCVLGNYAYLVGSSSGFQVVDISDPSMPAVLGSCTTPGTASDVDVVGGYAYLVDNEYVGGGYDSGFHVIGISDPANPSIVGSCEVSDWAYAVEVSGNYAYLAAEGAGLQVIDISDPANPNVAGSCAMASDARGIDISGDHAYVATSSSGLQVIDISNPVNPYVVVSLDTANGSKPFVSGKYLYLTLTGVDTSQLQVIDISDPSHPIHCVSYSVPLSVRGSFVSEDNVYMISRESGLFHVRKKFVPCVDVNWWSYNEITATIPAGFLPGTYDLHVVNPNSAPVTLHNAFTAKGANFAGDPMTGLRPLTVPFTDTSIGDFTTWEWDFGDGGTSTEQNPTYTYEETGDFTVSLAVTGPGGSDDETKTDYIHVVELGPRDRLIIKKALDGSRQKTKFYYWYDIEWIFEEKHTSDKLKFNNNRAIAMGDYDGDGVDELLLKNRNTGKRQISKFYEWSGNEWVWEATSTSDGFIIKENFKIAMGDYDGDGVDELIVKVVDNDKSKFYSWSMTENKWVLENIYYNDGREIHGNHAIAMGDYDGDGVDELLVKKKTVGDRQISRFYEWSGTTWVLEATYTLDGYKILDEDEIAMGKF